MASQHAEIAGAIGPDPASALLLESGAVRQADLVQADLVGGADGVGSAARDRPGLLRRQLTQGMVRLPIPVALGSGRSGCAAGDTRRDASGSGEYRIHDLLNIGETDLVSTTVEFVQSANELPGSPENAAVGAPRSSSRRGRERGRRRRGQE